MVKTLFHLPNALHIPHKIVFFKLFPYKWHILHHLAQALQTFGIGRIVEPQVQIPVASVFLMQVLQRALVVRLLIQFRIVFQTELHGAADDGVRVNEAVGLRHNAPVKRARRMVG